LVRFRRGSKLEVVNKLPRSNILEFSKQLKKLANLDIRKSSIPQYGKAKIEINSKSHELQIVSVPVLDGEKITIDIIDSVDKRQSLEKLGLWGESLNRVQQKLATNHGLILITSPQIKPSQDILRILLNTVDTNSHSIAYIGPTDAKIPNSTYIRAEDNFVKSIPTLDIGKYSVIGVGMVNTSNLACRISELVVKRQLIMAVFPSSTAIGALISWQRLVGDSSDLPFVISEHQVTSLCQYCKVSYEPTVFERLQLVTNFNTDNPTTMNHVHALEKLAIKASLGDSNEPGSDTKKVLRLFRRSTEGCRHCNFSGYGEDIGIFEVAEPTDTLRTVIGHNNSVIELQNIAVGEGMISLKLDALIKALRGIIDFKTVIAICATAG
jgi:type IV pilus assembly protein PilB